MNYDCLQTFSMCFQKDTGLEWEIFHHRSTKENFPIISKCRLKALRSFIQPKTHGELDGMHCNVILNRVFLEIVEWMIYIWAELLIRGYVTYIELIYIANYVLFGVHIFGLRNSIPDAWTRNFIGEGRESYYTFIL